MDTRRQQVAQKKVEEERARSLEEEKKARDADRRKKEREDLTDKKPLKVSTAKVCIVPESSLVY